MVLFSVKGAEAGEFSSLEAEGWAADAEIFGSDDPTDASFAAFSFVLCCSHMT